MSKRSRIQVGFALLLALGVSSSCSERQSTPPPGQPGAGADEIHPVKAPPTIACTTCHEGDRPAAVQFPPPAPSPTPGHFAPQECSDCHETLAAAPGFVFTHRNTPGNFGSTCFPCHEARRPSNHFVGRNCAECHRDPAVSWAESAVSPHPERNNELASCVKCHEQNRPTTTDLPSGTVQGHFARNDCASCHNPKNGTVAQFQFTHSVRGQQVTTCSACHASQRPTGVINSFNHAVAGAADCGNCHNQPGMTWSGATFNHSPPPASCNTCHSGDRPGGTVNGFNHTTTGNADCAGCHRQPGVTWSGAQFSHSPAPATCTNCHAENRPGGVVNRFNHTIAGMGDCAGCHRQPGVTWSGGVYNHSPRPSTCSGCHAGDRPTGTVNGFNHSTSGTGECAGCHNQPGIRWSGGGFNHSPTPTSCNGCHLNDRPDLNTSFPTSRGNFRHGQGDHDRFDCARCHTQPGVTFSTSNPGNVCANCHGGTGPVDD